MITILSTSADLLQPAAPPPDQTPSERRDSRQGFLTERAALHEVATSSAQRSPSTQCHLRPVPENPDRILDAPDLRCDFYLNILDWSSANVIAIALGETGGEETDVQANCPL